MNHRIIVTAALLGAAAAGARAQDRISTDHFAAWCENIGWTNWASTPAPGVVVVYPSFLSGFVWSENAGWINLGDGTPTNGIAYANATGADYGVNIAAGTGNLSGFGWGENIGHINFGGGALATPPQPARYDAAARRFRGYAWSENAGWMNLDDATKFVGTRCVADVDDGNGGGTPDGGVGIEDLLYYLAMYDAGVIAADVDDGTGTGTPDGGVGIEDLLYYLGRYDAGC
jgi:hypothetical protein